MNLDLRYQEALDYLYSFVDFSLSHQDSLSKTDFNLKSILKLVEVLDHPQLKYPVIHVAGSKGKGSVCSLCASALQAQGYKTGLYTSPHLKDFEERIQINGMNISKQELVQFVDEIKPYVSEISDLTTFHISTALAFWYFARKHVDIAVIEVGLGGRLDSTNVVSPTITAITSLYLEHTAILGHTLPEIAAEKGGIIKPGVPVILAPQKQAAVEVIQKIAAENEAPLFQVGVDYWFSAGNTSLESQTLLVGKGGEDQPVELSIHLLGPHQVENAAVAFAVLRELDRTGIPVRVESIQSGFATAHWPGRFEILQKEPPVIVDSAHTPDAAEKLCATLDALFPKIPAVLIFGVSEDKDIRGMLRFFAPRVRQIICSQSTHPRALPADSLREIAAQFDEHAVALENPGDALKAALQAAGETGLVLVAGSIFIAASVRIAWYEWMAQQPSLE